MADLPAEAGASLNGVSRGGWASYASRLQEAGASALELNIYYVSSRPGLSASDVEWHYLDVVRALQAIAIPLAVKLSPYFSSLTNLAGRPTGRAGADGCRWPPRPGSTPPATSSRSCSPGRMWPC